MSHVTESIFDGETHVIPLADVTYVRKFEHAQSDPPFPDLPERICVNLKNTNPAFFEIVLIGDEMNAFLRDWCRYRHELENPPASINVQIEPSLTKAQSRALSMITPIGCSTNKQPSLSDLETTIGDKVAMRAIAGRLDEMVSRFLSWKLPSDFAPDCGIRFAPLNHPNSWPVGTNLFTANQAKAMFEHVLESQALLEPIEPMQHRQSSQAALDVLAERRAQIEREGYDPQGDDCYVDRQLAKAAAAYTMNALFPASEQVPPSWPWDSAWWKPKGYRRDIVRAAALLVAEIERIDRAPETKSDDHNQEDA
jgi:hypothetical protein